VGSLGKRDVVRWLSAGSIAVLAGLRAAFLLSTFLLPGLAFVLVLAAVLQKSGLFQVPTIGAYLDPISIEASFTLLAIILASFGALRAWRLQKRDELLLQSLEEVQSFFEKAVKVSGSLNAHVALLSNLQAELMAGPHSLQAYWRAQYLDEGAGVAREYQRQLREMAVDVYALDARNLQAMTVHPFVFRAFKIAKRSLLELSEASNFYLPRSVDGDADRLIDILRRVPESEFAQFLKSFDELNPRMGGAVGGIRGGVTARFFPPGFTLAWAVFRSNRD